MFNANGEISITFEKFSCYSFCLSSKSFSDVGYKEYLVQFDHKSGCNRMLKLSLFLCLDSFLKQLTLSKHNVKQMSHASSLQTVINCSRQSGDLLCFVCYTVNTRIIKITLAQLPSWMKLENCALLNVLMFAL